MIPGALPQKRQTARSTALHKPQEAQKTPFLRFLSLTSQLLPSSPVDHPKSAGKSVFPAFPALFHLSTEQIFFPVPIIYFLHKTSSLRPCNPP